MAKEKEKKLGYLYFVEHGKTGKECADLTGVTEKTFSNWVIKYGWKKERDARIFSTKRRVENIKDIISNYAETTLEISRQMKEALASGDTKRELEIRESMASISDQVSKWNKALANVENTNKLPLSTYLFVMEDIFKSLQIKHPALYRQLIDFQEEHVHRKAEELG